MSARSNIRNIPTRDFTKQDSANTWSPAGLRDNTFKLDRLISSVLISKKSPRRKLFERSKYTRRGEAERERIDEKYIYRCVKRWNKGLEWRKVARRRVKRREEPPTAEQRFVALSLKAWMLKHSERIPGVESS